MCKTRSKDNARTSCDGDAAATATTTTTAAAAATTGQQRPRESGCAAATVQPVVAAGDATTMQQILLRDQRTTYHRLIGNGSAARATPARHFQQQQQQQAQVAGDQRSEIAGLLSEPMPWCLDCRASHHEERVQSHGGEHQRQPQPTKKRLVSATSDERKREAATPSDVDVELQRPAQRTCKVQRNRCDDSEQNDIVVLSEDDLSNPHCQLSSTVYRNKSFIALVTWIRLVGLLVALSLVSVESAPTAMTLESRRLDQAPKWLNPCGFAAEEFEGDLDVVQLNDATLLGNIVMQAKTALNYAHGFRDDFIKKTFHTDYADLHSTWKDNHYDWLPGPKQIPKKLGEDLDQDYLHKLEVRMLDTALLDAYEYMQRYAVGLEQIAWDQEDYSLDFRKQFKDSEYNLRSVLCELQMALAERGVAPRADVTREVMPVEFRDMSGSDTYRNLRDWLIFRDYMNGLEYVVQVFEHFIRCFES